MDISELTAQVERVSRTYAAHLGITRDADWHLLKLHEEIGELTQAHLMRTGRARAKGLSAEEIETSFRAEIADVLCHVLLLAHHDGVDLTEEVERKWLVRLDDSPELPPAAPVERNTRSL